MSQNLRTNSSKEEITNKEKKESKNSQKFLKGVEEEEEKATSRARAIAIKYRVMRGLDKYPNKGSKDLGILLAREMHNDLDTMEVNNSRPIVKEFRLQIKNLRDNNPKKYPYKRKKKEGSLTTSERVSGKGSAPTSHQVSMRSDGTNTKPKTAKKKINKKRVHWQNGQFNGPMRSVLEGMGAAAAAPQRPPHHTLLSMLQGRTARFAAQRAAAAAAADAADAAAAPHHSPPVTRRGGYPRADPEESRFWGRQRLRRGPEPTRQQQLEFKQHTEFENKQAPGKLQEQYNREQAQAVANAANAENQQQQLGCRPDGTNTACVLGGMGAGAVAGSVLPVVGTGIGACVGAACGLGAAVKRRFTGQGRKSRKKRGRKHKGKTRKHKKRHRRRKSTRKHKNKNKKRRKTRKI